MNVKEAWRSPVTGCRVVAFQGLFPVLFGSRFFADGPLHVVLWSSESAQWAKVFSFLLFLMSRWYVQFSLWPDRWYHSSFQNINSWGSPVAQWLSTVHGESVLTWLVTVQSPATEARKTCQANVCACPKFPDILMGCRSGGEGIVVWTFLVKEFSLSLSLSPPFFQEHLCPLEI